MSRVSAGHLARAYSRTERNVLRTACRKSGVRLPRISSRNPPPPVVRIRLQALEIQIGPRLSVLLEHGEIGAILQVQRFIASVQQLARLLRVSGEEEADRPLPRSRMGHAVRVREMDPGKLRER